VGQFSWPLTIKAMQAKRKYDVKHQRVKQNHAMTKRSLWQLSFVERNLAPVNHHLRSRLEQIKQSFIEKIQEEKRQQKAQDSARSFEELTPAEQLRHRYLHAVTRISETRGGAGLYLAHQTLRKDDPDIPEGSEEYMRRFIARYQESSNSKSSTH
jgi:hypothetical protein